MVPRTADGIVDNDALGQRAAVMRAHGRNRQHVVAATHEQHGLLADMPRQRDPLGQFRKPNALCEIGPAS